MGTHAPVAQAVLPPGSLLPAVAVLVPGTVVGRWLDAACPFLHQPRGPVSGGLSRTLQWVHAGGAAVPSPPAPVSHCRGWSHLGTVARAARSSPSHGVGSPMAPRGHCFTSPVSTRTRVTNCQRVPAPRLPAWWSRRSPRAPSLGRGDLRLGMDASCCRSSPGTCGGRTDPGNGNTKPGGLSRAPALLPLGWRGRSARERWKRQHCLRASLHGAAVPCEPKRERARNL